MDGAVFGWKIPVAQQGTTVVHAASQHHASLYRDVKQGRPLTDNRVDLR
jgi:hypothetical protein